ncbi:reverse transcriptase [Tanacetum coccineum]
MVVSTRNSGTPTGTSNGLVFDDETKKYIADTIATMIDFLGDDVRGGHTKVTKIDFPKFSGDDVVYKQAILKRFGNVYEDPLSELKNLKYETTARAYDDAFDTLLSRVEIIVLPEEELCEILEEEEDFFDVGIAEGCEMVLGIQSLATLGNIRCNFKELRMDFKYNGKRVSNRGTHRSTMEWLSNKTSEKAVKQALQAELHSVALCVFPNSATTCMLLEETRVEMNPLCQQVMDKYADVFEIPTELPLKRDHDHHRRPCNALGGCVRNNVAKQIVCKKIPKLMGFDYEIQYKKGVENVTADALTRIQHLGELFSVISASLTTEIYQKIVRSWSTYEKLKEELRRKGKLVVGDDQVLRTDLLKQFHEGSVGVHSRAYPNHKQGKTLIFVVVDRLTREAAIELLKFHLRRAQDRMKSHADRNRTNRQYELDDWVYLKLQPHRQVTIRKGKQHKLSPKYYGPFHIQEKGGAGVVTQSRNLPACGTDGLILVEPVAILERRLAKKGNSATVFVLLQWSNGSKKDATWEPIEDLQKKKFLIFKDNLEDKINLRRMD